jgi:hypothetical protein
VTTDQPTTPGPAADLIEHAARIIAAKKRKPYTAPYHWAGALWEEGMLVAPGAGDEPRPAPTDDITAWPSSEETARRFLTTYRALAPSYGYQPVGTADWDDESSAPRQLLVQTCALMLTWLSEQINAADALATELVEERTLHQQAMAERSALAATAMDWRAERDQLRVQVTNLSAAHDLVSSASPESWSWVSPAEPGPAVRRVRPVERYPGDNGIWFDREPDNSGWRLVMRGRPGEVIEWLQVVAAAGQVYGGRTLIDATNEQIEKRAATASQEVS